jgi:hypothetical protein
MLALAGAWFAWVRAGRRPGGRELVWPFRLFAVAAAVEVAKIFGAPGSVLLGSLPVLSLVWWVKYAAPLFLSLALLAAYGLDRIAHPARPRRRGAVRAALAAVVVLELIAVRPGPYAAAHDPLRPAPYIGWLQAHLAREPGWRICGVGTVLMPDLSAAFRLPDIRLEDTLIDREQYRLLFDGISAPKPPFMSMFISLDRLDARRLRALRGFGVRYLLSARDWRPEAAVAPALTRVYHDEITIWRVEGAKPWPGFPERGRRWLAAGCMAGVTLGGALLMAGLILL